MQFNVSCRETSLVDLILALSISLVHQIVLDLFKMWFNSLNIDEFINMFTLNSYSTISVISKCPCLGMSIFLWNPSFLMYTFWSILQSKSILC